MNDIPHITEDMVEVFERAAAEQIAALEGGLRELADAPDTWPEHQPGLCDISHNLKGQGSSFGYPLITQIGQSLNKLLKRLEQVDSDGVKIAQVHAQALRTVLDKGIRGAGGPAGETLVSRLQALADRAGA